MDRGIDHTAEARKKKAEISVNARDNCTFFQRRESALLAMRECWYCAYGKFEGQPSCLNPSGLCKFQK